MKSFRRFFIDYLMIPLLVPAACAAIAAYHVSREIDANDYAVLREAWPRLHQPTRDAIADAMKRGDGTISTWAYTKLFRLAMNDAGALTLAGASDSAADERAALVRTMNPATLAGKEMSLMKGTAFECLSYFTATYLIDAKDNSPVQCIVTNDVHATLSGKTIIPRKSRLFGWKKGDQVEWTSWTTEGGIVVGDKVLNGTAFVSRIPLPTHDPLTGKPLDDDKPFIVIALHDIDVPAIAVSAN
ncbi:hypothetical protein BVER_03839c [Candidatus Burkholderia verschuerenii]|uniref:Uncharacterized protein n=1 Tax=Candidatus Burkholderia verschuerenii TaxID=242163 RepID=A0A0L0MDM7_9BURK|nr:hypothetical protein [Candidatus Burkholderia verschuerenii]KND60401.1 hypothetical protein BVER_03839c [Candidatus Burkholderia verschuerenii]